MDLTAKVTGNILIFRVKESLTTIRGGVQGLLWTGS